MKPRAEFILKIRAVPGDTDHDGTLRLRSLLKRLLRSFGFQVVEVSPVKPEASK